ncbi:MAG: folP [Nevskia sp.]|nr:folP [Nevskia sp.]
MFLKLPNRTLDLRQPQVMGVLNLTPDSFFDGGRYSNIDAALTQARAMLAEGAAIIDVGGESSRPGAVAVSLDEELARVLPVIERIKHELDCIVSIDTTKPAVMDAACSAGAELINDITALGADGALAVACRHSAAVCLMHMQGEPRMMQQQPQYGDVVAEVHAFLAARIAACAAAGLARERLLVDPGFGFGKALPHNLQMLAHLDRFLTLGVPLLVGLSRKSMFSQLLGLPLAERLPPSIAAAAIAVRSGANIVRAHDVAATVAAVRLAGAVRQAAEARAP